MTLGKKLAGYRKLAGMTQQQLGDILNLSAQAISKWEKDMTEPDVSTLRALAELYKVTVDELLDPNGGFPDVTDSEGSAETAFLEPTASAQTLGFCTRCGVVVNAETVGCTEPAVLCKKCAQAHAEQQAADARRQRAAAEAAKRRRLAELESRRKKLRYKRVKSLVAASLATVVFLGIIIAVMVADFHPLMPLIAVAGAYMIFSFVCCLFYKGIVRYISFVPGSKVFFFMQSIIFIGQDNIAVRILLLFLLGVIILPGILLTALLGAATVIVGSAIGMLCALFAFPRQMAKVSRAIREGVDPNGM